jgi:hypothetical protein
MRALRFLLGFAVLLTAAGCATVTGEARQSISIHAVDAANRPVSGLRCRASNASAEYFGSAPMHGLEVRRSASDLVIECRRGNLVARATAVSRGTALLAALLPGGTAALVIDHLTGYRYAYPTEVRLRVGQHLIVDPAAKPQERMLAEIDADSVELQ